ncbi:hypothetical protein [Gorillibacterium sp. sgz5001074]
MKLWLIKRLLQKLAEKGIRLDPADIMTQTTADDLIHLLKELIL